MQKRKVQPCLQSLDGRKCLRVRQISCGLGKNSVRGWDRGVRFRTVEQEFCHPPPIQRSPGPGMAPQGPLYRDSEPREIVLNQNPHPADVNPADELTGFC
jgi:hypothetical protein